MRIHLQSPVLIQCDSDMDFVILIRVMNSSYLPMERWQHNLEHGSIVVLYHPCLASHHLTSVISLVSSCLKKYVSTPSLLPDPHQPLMLLGWGAFRKFSSLDKKAIRNFVVREGYLVESFNKLAHHFPITSHYVLYFHFILNFVFLL